MKCQSECDTYGDGRMRNVLVVGLFGLGLLAGCNTYNNTPANNEALMRMGGAMYSNAVRPPATQTVNQRTILYDDSNYKIGYILNGVVYDNQNYQVGTVVGGNIYNYRNYKIGTIQSGQVYWD